MARPPHCHKGGFDSVVAVAASGPNLSTEVHVDAALQLTALVHVLRWLASVDAIAFAANRRLPVDH